MKTGIYVVLLPTCAKPIFLRKGTGGKFKGLEPNYSLKYVEQNWVKGARVLYVGKAAGRKGLRDRINSLVKFGLGRPVSHRGGRLLWQLKDNKKFLIRWRACPAASAHSLEKKMIRKFKDGHDELPFANLTD